MILPVTDDRDSGPFFAAAREGKLVFRACSVCQRGIHPPVPFCTHCGGEGHWREASGLGHVHSFTVVMHQIHPDYPAPYTLVSVELADNADVRLMGRLDGAVDLAPGAKMRVRFDEVAPDTVLPNWEPS
jgi:uncharacterized OB-fold protein